MHVCAYMCFCACVCTRLFVYVSTCLHVNLCQCVSVWMGVCVVCMDVSECGWLCECVHASVCAFYCVESHALKQQCHH